MFLLNITIILVPVPTLNVFFNKLINYLGGYSTAELQRYYVDQRYTGLVFKGFRRTGSRLISKLINLVPPNPLGLVFVV